MRIGSLCSGYGGLDLAVESVFGATPAWFVEFDKAPSAILAHHWPDVPNHGDVKLTDWLAVEPVDILTAGYPCQPFSHAGKRQGTDDPRHLWPDVFRAISDLRPGLVVLENVRGHVSLGLDAVIGDLSSIGYDARWTIVRAADAGACHGRARIFIVAHPHMLGGDWPRLHGSGERWGQESKDGSGEPTDADGTARPQPDIWPGTWIGTSLRDKSERLVVDSDRQTFGVYTDAIQRHEQALGRPAPPISEPGKNGPRLAPRFVEWMMMLPDGWVTDPAIGLSRSQQLKALGNGVVPAQAELALRVLLDAETMPPNLGLDVLPTPVVNDMGDGKTPPQWDNWTQAMQAKHGNGNGHGKSLAIEAQRVGGSDVEISR